MRATETKQKVVPDIWRCAASMIERFGDGADIAAATCADAFQNHGDLDGQRVWLNVVKAINRLQRVEPGETMQ